MLAVPLASANAGLAVADFNGDRKLDLVVTLSFAGHDGSGGGLVVLLGNGNGTFRPPLTLATPKQAFSVAAGPPRAALPALW